MFTIEATQPFPSFHGFLCFLFITTASHSISSKIYLLNLHQQQPQNPQS
jgi:hypothetical protein